VWRPGIDKLAEGEVLEHDPSAYVMLHAMSVEWPCLSFDVVPDRLGASRTKLPLTATFVAGTQADTPGANKLLVLRATNLCKTQEKPLRDDSDDEEDSDESDEDGEDEPQLYTHRIPHPGGVNRVRVMPQVRRDFLSALGVTRFVAAAACESVCPIFYAGTSCDCDLVRHW
jgi:ribosome assembly protein RRB1